MLGCAKYYDVGLTYDEVSERADQKNVGNFVEARPLPADHELLLVPLVETDQLGADRLDYILPPSGSGRQLRPANEIETMIDEWCGLVLRDSVVVKVIRGEDREYVAGLADSWARRNAD